MNLALKCFPTKIFPLFWIISVPAEIDHMNATYTPWSVGVPPDTHPGTIKSLKLSVCKPHKSVYTSISLQTWSTRSDITKYYGVLGDSSSLSDKWPAYESALCLLKLWSFLEFIKSEGKSILLTLPLQLSFSSWATPPQKSQRKM